MIINYDMSKLTSTLKDFYNATGINMDLLKADFTYVCSEHFGSEHYCLAVKSTAKGQATCPLSDACLLEECKKSNQPRMHECHAGLIDVAVPILYEDTILGYLLFGEMKTDKPFSMVAGYLESLGLDPVQMKTYYDEIPVYDSEQIQSICNIAGILVKHILLENMLKPDFDENIQKAIAYIEDHLDKDLSIRTLSQKIHVSKSVLYQRFHACFHCTVSEYINTRRVEKAAVLLTQTGLPIEQIAQQAGFSGTSYFSKTFRRLKGVTPSKYRKTL